VRFAADTGPKCLCQLHPRIQASDSKHHGVRHVGSVLHANLHLALLGAGASQRVLCADAKAMLSANTITRGNLKCKRSQQFLSGHRLVQSK
jgi:hypothetical protein